LKLPRQRIGEGDAAAVEAEVVEYGGGDVLRGDGTVGDVSAARCYAGADLGFKPFALSQSVANCNNWNLRNRIYTLEANG
jgi:hypothetical protein